MTENIEAIVLGHTKFGESSVVVHTLSEEYGRRGFLAHVGKKAGMALLLPMNILEMDGFNHKVLVTRGVCEEECSLMLKEFFKGLRQRLKVGDDKSRDS